MCGIAGLLNIDTTPWDGAPPDLAAMLAAMRHRGPDHCGSFVDGPLAMGVDRLIIVDPDPRSNQPFSSPDGRFTMAYNGEIYNFRELRRLLEDRNHACRTAGDTEVLLALYQMEGTACLQRLRGMFAFAVWDHRDQSLFIARDRIGEKPLYFFQNDQLFAFASELPALLASPRIPRRLEPTALHSAMLFMASVAPATPFAGIRKLPPAHFLTISPGPKAAAAEIHRYWSCRFDPDKEIEDPDRAIEEIRACLDDTVSLMVDCDTPVGALLSGGLDSSAIVATMAARLKAPFATFRISGSSGPDAEGERASALAVARHHGLQHHEYLLGPEDLRVLEQIIRHHGEPVATAVVVDAHILAGHVGKQLRVALCGAGADELFGGYREHQLFHDLDRRFRHWRELEETGTPAPDSNAAEELLAWDIYNRTGRDQPHLVFPEIRYTNTDLFTRIYSPRMQEAIRATDPLAPCVTEFLAGPGDGLFNAFIRQQLSCVAQYCLAELGDRTGMAHSLEIRSPFLDVRMIDLALRIPPRFKVDTTLRNGGLKHILRQAMADRLPQQTLRGPKLPYGGTTPYDQWLRRDQDEFFERKLQSEALGDSGLYDMAAIRELFTLYQCGAAFDRDLFFGLASIAIWMETFL